jgi:cyclopropane fatty-acyl-phospholipid synthase-like methyltransferase
MTVSSFYDKFYTCAAVSAAHGDMCERVYGRNLCQHGMADLPQLEAMLTELEIHVTDRVLDLGCGNGYITEYLYDRRPARYVGIDCSEVAIEQAQKRMAASGKPLTFAVGDISRLAYPAQEFDRIVSIDTHYFFEELEAWLSDLYAMLKPGGRIAIFSDEGTKQPGRDDTHVTAAQTLMGQRFARLGFEYTSVNLTAANQAHWRLKKRVVEELRARFMEEGNEFLYGNRLGECTHSNRDLDCRFLFVVRKP